MHSGRASGMAKKSDPTTVYRFTAPLEKQVGRFGWSYVEFPHDVKEIFGKRGEVRVKCRFNGVPADRALMPTRSGFHILSLSGALRKAAGLKKIGDPVRVELWLDPEPDHIHVPMDLSETLDFMPELKQAWEKVTPGLRRSMCLWIDSGKTAPTREKRIAEVLRRLENGQLRWNGPAEKG